MRVKLKITVNPQNLTHLVSYSRKYSDVSNIRTDFRSREIFLLTILSNDFSFRLFPSLSKTLRLPYFIPYFRPAIVRIFSTPVSGLWWPTLCTVICRNNTLPSRRFVRKGSYFSLEGFFRRNTVFFGFTQAISLHYHTNK